MGRELIVDIPVNSRSYADVYIDNTTRLTIDLPGTRNADRVKAAMPLAIKVAARPNDVNKPIPWEPMVVQEKLKAEGGLAETKIILGWHFKFCTLTVTLPKQKHIAWSRKIQTKNSNQYYDKESPRINNRATRPHWLCHPLGFPFFEPPQNPPITSLQQKSNYN